MTYDKTEKALADSLGIPYEIEQVKINGHIINYLVAGKGPPVLLIHGGNIGWGQWYKNIPNLAQHFTVYAIDLPGAGRSSTINYSELELERDFVTTVEKFILTKTSEQPFSIVGSSLGGWIALVLAIRKKVQIYRLISIDSLGFTHQMRMADRLMGVYSFASFLSKTLLKPVRHNKRIEYFLRGVFLNKDLELSLEFIEYFYCTMSRSHNLLLISSLSSIKGMKEHFILNNKLSEVNISVLLIWGKEDKLLPLEWCMSAMELIPTHKLVIMKNSAHFPSLEESAKVNTEIVNFLKLES